MLLAAPGADVHAFNEHGLQALHLAAQQGSVPALKQLLDAGADPSVPTRDRRMPWELAKEHPAIAKRLKELASRVQEAARRGVAIRQQQATEGAAARETLPARASAPLPACSLEPLHGACGCMQGEGWSVLLCAQL